MYKPSFLDLVSSILWFIITDSNPNLIFFENKALYTYNLS